MYRVVNGWLWACLCVFAFVSECHERTNTRYQWVLTSVCACDVTVTPLFADFKPLVLPDAAVRQYVYGGLRGSEERDGAAK